MYKNKKKTKNTTPPTRLTPLADAERTCVSTISTILGDNSFVYILTPKVGDRTGACKCAAWCARGSTLMKCF